MANFVKTMWNKGAMAWHSSHVLEQCYCQLWLAKFERHFLYCTQYACRLLIECEASMPCLAAGHVHIST